MAASCWWGRVLAACSVAVAVGGCGGSSKTGQHGVASTAGPVHPTDARTFSIRPLVQSLSGTCPSSPANPADALLPTQIKGSPPGCAEVGPAAVTAGDVSGAQLEAADTASVALTPAGLAALDQLTSTNYGKQVAMVVLGTVVAEPTVYAQQTNGTAVVGPMPSSTALAFVKAFAGATSVPPTAAPRP